MQRVTHDERNTSPTEPASSAARSAEAPPWQFRLSTLLWSVAALSVLLAVMHQVGPTLSVVLLWVLALLAAHVLGNAWGTRKSQRLAGREPSDDEKPWQSSSGVQLVQFAPATQLRDSRRLGWLSLVFVAAGACLGGVIGTALLLFSRWPSPPWPSVVLGGVSAAVIGGLGGFIASSFARVFSRAWREAAAPVRRAR